MFRRKTSGKHYGHGWGSGIVGNMEHQMADEQHERSSAKPPPTNQLRSVPVEWRQPPAHPELGQKSAAPTQGRIPLGREHRASQG